MEEGLTSFAPVGRRNHLEFHVEIVSTVLVLSFPWKPKLFFTSNSRDGNLKEAQLKLTKG